LVLALLDPAARWFEVKDMNVQSSRSIVIVFDDLWLSRYPRPELTCYGNGKEYNERVLKE
jgi:hypothetical protein